MSVNKSISVGGLAVALSLTGLGIGLAGCGGNQAKTQGASQAKQEMKGTQASCGAGSCSGDKATKTEEAAAEETKEGGAEASCGAGSCSGDKTKGTESSCG